MRVTATVTTEDKNRPPVVGDYSLRTLLRDHRSGALTVRELELGDIDNGSLPPQLWQLTDLRSLTLNHLQLRSLPPQILRLRKLTSLSVANNQLDELPDEVFRLPLQRLILADNQLGSLPTGIAQLQHLRVLDLRRNRLGQLPAAIASLQKLQSIHLDHNNLDTLPSDLGKLANLGNLTVAGNQLTTLPTSIGELDKLTNLDLSYNSITDLPAELGQLKYLQNLDIAHNLLQTLPFELGGLAGAVHLSLQDNPLSEILHVFADRGTKPLLAYLRTLAAAEPQYEAKVLLVGEGNVGKTSLVAALQGKPFVKDRPTTHGIDKATYSVPHPNLDADIHLHTWDFGGQDVYRVTHQFFFSQRALYLLVWRPREGQEENAIDAWCQRIRLRVGDNARVLIVATHRDERSPELDYPSLKRKFGHLLVGAYSVDNQSSRGLDELRQAIAAEAAALPQMGEPMSPHWISARDHILSVPDQHITYTEFVTICSQHDLAAVETTALANLMHDLGYIIHYSADDGLRDIVVLQPDWLTKAISYVLEDDVTKQAAGVLLHRRLINIWPDRNRSPSYPRKLHPYFLRLMEKFDVSYRLPERQDASLVGQLVPYQRPELPWEGRDSRSSSDRTLSMICRVKESPPGLIAWLTVRNHRFSVGKHWRTGVFLKHTPYSSEALLELVDPHHLSLDVHAPSPDYFFSILRDSLEDLISARWPGLTYELLVPCPQEAEGGTGCTGVFKLRALETLRERGQLLITCQDCVESQDVLRLLTGFYLPPLPEAPELKEIREELRSVAHTVGRIEGQAAVLAAHVRALVKATSAEVSDCPRLATIVRLGGVVRDHCRITLWCEHPGAWHPCQRYEVRPPKKWLATVAPYALLVLRILRSMVPIAAASQILPLSSEDLAGLKDEFQMMSELLDELPTDIEPPRLDEEARNTLTLAEGAALRALRTLLLEEDPGQLFGGLRRVFTGAGDFLWVCEEHYQTYDPGVPKLPYDLSSR